MIEIVVMRHGQSMGDIERRHEGRADLELSALGRQQAQRAAEWIARNHPPDTIYASPLRRAAVTAEYVAAESAAPLIYEDGLRELDNGHQAGLTFEEADRRFPELRTRLKPHQPYPGGESDIAFRARAEITWQRILEQTRPNQRIVIVAHGAIISRLFQCFLQLPLPSNVVIQSDDTGIHMWRIDGNDRWVVFANRSEHLIDR